MEEDALDNSVWKKVQACHKKDCAMIGLSVIGCDGRRRASDLFFYPRSTLAVYINLPAIFFCVCQNSDIDTLA